MGDTGGYSYCDPGMNAIRNAVLKRFQERGVPEYRWDELWTRWLHQKGRRAPGQLGEKHVVP